MGSPSDNDYESSKKDCWLETNLLHTNSEKKPIANDEEISLLLPTKLDMIISKKRIIPLDKNGERKTNELPPSDFNSPKMTNRKKRLVVYHKIYRFLYPKQKGGKRVVLPSCCVGKVRATYPDDHYEQDEDLQNTGNIKVLKNHFKFVLCCFEKNK